MKIKLDTQSGNEFTTFVDATDPTPPPTGAKSELEKAIEEVETADNQFGSRTISGRSLETLIDYAKRVSEAEKENAELKRTHSFHFTHREQLQSKLTTAERERDELKGEFKRAYTNDGLGLVEENIKLRQQLSTQSADVKLMVDKISLKPPCWTWIEWIYYQFPASVGCIPLREYFVGIDKALSTPTARKCSQPE